MQPRLHPDEGKRSPRRQAEGVPPLARRATFSKELKHQAELAAARRDADVQTLYAAMRAYNSYIRAMVAPDSGHAKTAPRLAKHRRSSGGVPTALKPPTTGG